MNPEKNTASDITIDIESNCDTVNFDKQKMSQMVCQTIKHFDIKKANVTIAVLNEEEIVSINTKFLNRKNPTDVISFDLSEDNQAVRIFDIAVNAEMANAQAKLRTHSAEAELALYIIHGLLHNLGFDDLAENDAIEMHKAEDKFLSQFGYGIVYNKQQLQ